MQQKRAGAVGRARYLRKNATLAEDIIWRWLRDRRFGEWKFRRQHPVGSYVLDFYCERLRLAIELDGEGHQEWRDRFRDAVLRRRFGIAVLRLNNDDVIRQPDVAAQHIAYAVAMRTGSPERYQY